MINKTLNLNNAVPVPSDYSVTGPITFTVDTESLASDLFQELQTLEGLLVAYTGDVAAESAYNSDLAQVQFQMAQLGLTETDGGTTFYKTQDAVPFITVSPIFAEAGTITVDGDNLLGSGRLLAPGNVSITITNNSPAFLRLNSITIPQSFGGTLFFDGATVTSDAGIGGINQSMTTPAFAITTSNTSSPPSVTITNTFSSKDPENIGTSQTATLTQGSKTLTGLNTTGFFVGETVSAPGAGIPAGTTIAQINGQTSITMSQNATQSGSFSVSFNTFDGVNFASPDIDIDGPITAPPTVLTVSSQGSVVVNANIDVGSVTISAGANFIQSYVPGIDSIGGDPATLWSNVTSLTEANAAAANPNPPLGSPLSLDGSSSGTAVQQAIATDLAATGGNLMVANDVFIAPVLERRRHDPERPAESASDDRQHGPVGLQPQHPDDDLAREHDPGHHRRGRRIRRLEAGRPVGRPVAGGSIRLVYERLSGIPAPRGNERQHLCLLRGPDRPARARADRCPGRTRGTLRRSAQYRVRKPQRAGRIWIDQRRQRHQLSPVGNSAFPPEAGPRAS